MNLQEGIQEADLSKEPFEVLEGSECPQPPVDVLEFGFLRVLAELTLGVTIRP